MRMTRAALRAQESYETLSAEINDQLKKQGLSDESSSSSSPFEHLIHEDSDKENGQSHGSGGGDDKVLSQDENAGRAALRDITDENYPTTQIPDLVELTMADAKKSGKKGKAGKGKKRKVNVEEDTNIESSSVQDSPSNLTPQSLETLQGDISATEQSSEQSQPGQDINEVSQKSPSSTDDSSKSVDSSNFVEISPNVSTSEAQAIDLQDTEISVADDLTFKLAQAAADAMPETPHKLPEHTSKTPKFDPEVHLSAETSLPASKQPSEDSFVCSIKTRSPTKLEQTETSEVDSDSFVENIISRSPSKPQSSPRVEDSVEALDALEDAIEKFSENLPALHELKPKSPSKLPKTPLKSATPLVKKNSSTTPVSNKKTTTTPLVRNKTGISPSFTKAADVKTPKTLKEKLIATSTVKERIKALESKPSQPVHRRTTSVTANKLRTSVMPVQTKPQHTSNRSVPTLPSSNNMSFSNSPAKRESVVEKRVTSGPLSTSRPAFVPAKSSKPITKSTFVLPGEAVAAKLKAQREERQKREEEATEKKTQVKAAEKTAQVKIKPVATRPSRPITIPRETKLGSATSRTKVAGNTENKENVAPVKPIVRPNGPGVTVSKTRPDATKANSSARRATAVGSSAATAAARRTTVATAHSERVISTSSTTSNPGDTVTNATSTINNNNKGKEVYSRHRINMEAEQREKKEKEAAAKRARAEAAERGRIASREWAEKQKKKLIEKTQISNTTAQPDAASAAAGAIVIV